jgi:hypothetical protein
VKNRNKIPRPGITYALRAKLFHLRLGHAEAAEDLGIVLAASSPIRRIVSHRPQRAETGHLGRQ